MRLARLACLLLLGVSVAACNNVSNESGLAAQSEALVPQPPGNLNHTDWVLVETGNFDQVRPSVSSTIRFEDGTASGSGPCNRYNLAFVQKSDDSTDVTTGKVRSTLIACKPRLARAEHKFFDALEAVDTAQKESDRLVLSGPGDVRLTFDRADKQAGK